MRNDMLTEAGERLPAVPWQIYPRPQLVREGWQCLNGDWEFDTKEDCWEETIKVPFCPESRLSGIRRDFTENTVFHYKKYFTVDIPLKNRKILLHFGAVDQVAAVYLNGSCLGVHLGGYLPFTYDVTDHIRTENELIVTATDPLLHTLPWGKQSLKRGGMWYTPVSGIWQTVWLESVPRTYVKKLTVRTEGRTVSVRAEGIGTGILRWEGPVCRALPSDASEYGGAEAAGECRLVNGQASFTVEDPRYWSPREPWLYPFTLRSGEDCVRSYFALRSLSIENDSGHERLCLNGEPFFFHGVLDQGYWSDGIYTPAEPAAYEQDIRLMQEFGFNTLRKHIKVEPEQFYYDCDRLGMAVFQDMVNCGDYGYVRDTVIPTVGILWHPDKNLHKEPRVRDAFERYMKETVLHLMNHPCICYWTIFNEGWGQFLSDEMYEKLKAIDDSRFIDSTSGWFAQKKSDVDSRHIYFKDLAKSLKQKDRPLVLSEFGGRAYPEAGHCFDPEKIYGIKKYPDRETCLKETLKLYREGVVPAFRRGELSAAILTQLSDVEEEVNGFITYDRRLRKYDPEDFLPIARDLGTV